MIKNAVLILLVYLILCATAQEQKRLYAGLRLGGSVGMVFPTGDDYRSFYENTDGSDSEWWDGGSFDVTGFISVQFTNTFALHTEIMATRFGYFGEKYEYDGITEKNLISRRALLFPILVKYTGRQFNRSIQFFIGPHFTYNFGQWRWHYSYREDGSVSHNSKYHPQPNITYDDNNNIIGIENQSITSHIKYPPVGITVGASFGYITKKAGTVFVDVRFFEDLKMISQGYEEEDGTLSWESILLRGKLSFSVGYEFGFIDR